jgi:energy-coupling factor transporter ATP-binding protein EcfA2
MTDQPTILIHGPQGSGKTRLANSIAAMLQVTGFATAIADEGEPLTEADVEGGPGPLIEIHTTNQAVKVGDPPFRLDCLIPAAVVSPFEAVRELYSDKMTVPGAEAINAMVRDIHGRNVTAGWWTDLKTGESLVGKRNFGELLCLVHSEVSEAMEGHRKGLMDDKLPARKMAEVELADTIIRIFDIAGGYGFDLGGALVEKLAYNATREDHKQEVRRLAGGKAY